MLQYYVIIGVLFIGAIISVPFFLKNAKNKNAGYIEDMEPFASQNGFFLKTLGNNVRFAFNQLDEDELEKIRMGVSTATVLPAGKTSILIKSGRVEYKHWKYNIKNLNIDEINIEAGYVYSAYLFSQKDSKAYFKQNPSNQMVHEHLFDGLNPDKVTLYITRMYYK